MNRAGFLIVHFYALLMAFPLLAAEGHGDEAHGGTGGGLPQFDPSTFTSQIFWLAVTFVVLYIVFSGKILPAISSTLENRRTHIQNDLEMAEKLRKESERVQEAYEGNLEKAKLESSRMVDDVHVKAKIKSEEYMKSLKEKSDSEIRRLEDSLAKGKAEAMEQMTTIAAEVASEAASKIVGISTDIDQAKSFVKAINGREAA